MCNWQKTVYIFLKLSASKVKLHSFPKTGQKPVFLRKKKVTKYYETSKKSEVVSQKRWSIIKKVKVSNMIPKNAVYKGILKPRIFFGGKSLPWIKQFLEKWLKWNLYGQYSYHELPSFTKWNQLKKKIRIRYHAYGISGLPPVKHK